MQTGGREKDLIEFELPQQLLAEQEKVQREQAASFEFENNDAPRPAEDRRKREQEPPPPAKRIVFGTGRNDRRHPEILKGTPFDIFEARAEEDTAYGFAAALVERGLRIAFVSDADRRLKDNSGDLREE